MLPAMHVLLHKWAPVEDRSWMTSATFSGSLFGTMLTYPLGALLCEKGFDNGWPSAFYIFGVIGCIWTIAWCILTSESPLDHCWISKAEKNYLAEACHLTNHKKKNPPFPTKSV